MDAIDLLTSQHDEVKNLFEQIEQAQGDPGRTRPLDSC